MLCWRNRPNLKCGPRLGHFTTRRLSIFARLSMIKKLTFGRWESLLTNWSVVFCPSTVFTTIAWSRWSLKMRLTFIRSRFLMISSLCSAKCLKNIPTKDTQLLSVSGFLCCSKKNRSAFQKLSTTSTLNSSKRSKRAQFHQRKSAFETTKQQRAEKIRPSYSWNTFVLWPNHDLPVFLFTNLMIFFRIFLGQYFLGFHIINFTTKFMIQ